MSFKELQLQHSYSSEQNDLLHDFYIPVLKEANLYRRITGYFSSSSFGAAAEGMAYFVARNEGRLEYIINIQLSPEDYEMIEKGTKNAEDLISQRMIQDIDSLYDAYAHDHVRMLGWLIAQNVLEIRVGYITEANSPTAILHQKAGIMIDKNGAILTFNGSNNESAQGWMYNSEKFKVFMNWESNSDPYIQQDLDDFDELWSDRAKKTKVIPFPDAVKAHLIKMAPQTKGELTTVLQRLGVSSPSTLPKMVLREYQNDAIRAWFENDCQGIFEMATGTGKTFTALGALQELSHREKRLITVISCPYLHLCNQWKQSIEKMGIELPLVFASSIDLKWKDKLYEKILDNKLKKVHQFIILTTHDTASSQKFIDLLKKAGSPLCLIGDEVHGMGSTTHLEALQPFYQYRLGLSATPERYFDEIGSDRLIQFFNNIIFEFSLHRAINEINPDTGKSFLVPYEYYPITIELTTEDMERYSNISGKIALLSHKKNRTMAEEHSLEQKLRERADIVKNCNTKYPAFSQLIHELKQKGALRHTLIYCSPQQIQIVQGLIKDEKDIIQHKFTFEEDAIQKKAKHNNMTEREFLLDNFDKGVYNVLVAIRCLDEGVDVPSTEKAILMCSSGNPKEYIQRRGRVLRRYPGKKKAVIYDLTALPNTVLSPNTVEAAQKMVENQLTRLEEFANDAMNKDEVQILINQIRERYGI